MAALTAGWNTFKDPESAARNLTREQLVDRYLDGWMYYRSEKFSRRNGQDWSVYLAARELYKHTRLMYNPVPMIVDFYVDNIWRPARNDDHEALVTPATAKTDPELLEAIAQIDQWSNFLSDAQKIKRYAAATGNVLIEGVDDLTREKVLHRTVWPGFVTEITLNDTGDVLGYVLEYDVYDPAMKSTYRYRKEVSKDGFRYFRDDKPFKPEGKTAPEEENPYGFTFAVWIRHTDDGSDIGLPACKDFDKVDEANSLGSHLHDNIHKAIESPKIVSAEGEVLPLIGATAAQHTVSGQSVTTLIPQDPRLNWVVFKAKPGASVHDLAGALRLAEAHPYLTNLLASFTDDYPELQAAAIIRENSQLSGAALERMLTPAQNRLDGSQANYNQQLIKLRQMQIAVAGFRRNGGGWTRRDAQQELFRPYNLQSYAEGKLDFALQRSVLVQNTEAETEDLLMKKAERAVVLDTLVDEAEQFAIAGYSEEEAAAIRARKARENDIITDDGPDLAGGLDGDDRLQLPA